MCCPVLIQPDDTKRLDMLAECLRSIRAQIHTDYEVVLKDALPQTPVVENERVCDAMNEFGIDSRLKYIVRADRNIHDGLNQALRESTGDILHYICGDDLAGDAGTLAFVNEQFCKHTEPAWLYGSTQCILEDGSEGPWGIQPWATLEETLIHNRMGCGATFWNRAMMEKIGYWDSQYRHAADYDYWCRCYRVTAPMYTTRALCQVRNWSGSISRPNVALLESEAESIAVRNRTAHELGEQVQKVEFTYNPVAAARKLD